MYSLSEQNKKDTNLFFPSYYLQPASLPRYSYLYLGMYVPTYAIHSLASWLLSSSHFRSHHHIVTSRPVPRAAEGSFLVHRTLLHASSVKGCRCLHWGTFVELLLLLLLFYFFWYRSFLLFYCKQPASRSRPFAGPIILSAPRSFSLQKTVFTAVKIDHTTDPPSPRSILM